jgi:hypothetical protein
MVKKQSTRAEQIRRANKAVEIDPSRHGPTGATSLSKIEKVAGATNDDRSVTMQHRLLKRRPGRLELGISILQHVEGQLNRADSKAQFTFSLDTLLIASSAFLGLGAIDNVARINAPIFSHRMVAVLGIAMFVTLLVSTVYALLAVIPRFTPSNRANRNIFYFGNIVQQQRRDFAEQYLSLSNQEIERMLMSEIHDLSGIAKQKFALIRTSHIFLFFSLGLWAIIQLIILLIR